MSVVSKRGGWKLYSGFRKDMSKYNHDSPRKEFVDSNVYEQGKSIPLGGSNEDKQALSYTAMDTRNFFENRNSRISFCTLPTNFFESKSSLRTWGASSITDPAVQSLPKQSEVVQPFHVLLPGYNECDYKCFLNKRKCGTAVVRDKILGPDLSNFPVWIPKYAPDPYFQEQPIGYKWDDQPSFKMDRFPYVNAHFRPLDPNSTKMYGPMVPWCAYPYGVPVINNERTTKSLCLASSLLCHSKSIIDTNKGI